MAKGYRALSWFPPPSSAETDQQTRNLNKNKHKPKQLHENMWNLVLENTSDGDSCSILYTMNSKKIWLFWGCYSLARF